MQNFFYLDKSLLLHDQEAQTCLHESRAGGQMQLDVGWDSRSQETSLFGKEHRVLAGSFPSNVSILPWVPRREWAVSSSEP